MGKRGERNDDLCRNQKKQITESVYKTRAFDGMFCWLTLFCWLISTNPIWYYRYTVRNGMHWCT